MARRPLGKFTPRETIRQLTDFRWLVTFWKEVRFYAVVSFNAAVTLVGDLTVGGDLTTTGDVLLADGAASAPSLAFASDPDTGIYSGGTDILSVSAGNTQALKITDPQIMGKAGSASAPIWSFIADPDTGMYSAGTNLIGMSAAGSNSMTIAPSAVLPKVVVTGTTGSASAPAYSFEGDPDTGMYRYGDNALGLATGGSYDMIMGGGQVSFLVGSTSAPSITFAGDPDTGMYRYGNDQVALVAGGSIMFRGAQDSTPDEVRIPPAYAATGSDSALGVTSTGLLRRQTSARKYKERIDYDTAHLADVELRPVDYWRKATEASEGDGEAKHLLGFIADDLYEANPLMGRLEKGEVEDFDDRAVLAVLAAKVNRLEKKMENCTCK